MKTLRLGTRKSALAQAQANHIAERLRVAISDLQIEIVLITTTGDRMSSSPAATGGGSMVRQTSGGDGRGGLKALFTKELEDALLDNRIDLAVHSMKDVAAELPPGLILGAVPEREDPRDAWISKDKTAFKNLPKSAKVGTGAVRRQAQLKLARPDLEIVPLRGNVDTRLRKLAESGLDGIVLAMAGLKRLGRATEATETLPIELMLPAVGQGCLAIEIRQKDMTADFLKILNHEQSHRAALAERAFLETLGGNCQTPIAAFARVRSSTLEMTGLVAAPDGHQAVRDSISGSVSDPRGLGVRLARKLLGSGADKLLKS